MFNVSQFSFALWSTQDSTLYEQPGGGVSRKTEDAYPTGSPGPYSQFFSGVRVAHLLLLLCMYYLVILCSLLFLSVFHVWSLSLDYIILISSRI